MRAFLVLVFAGLVALGAGSVGYQAGLMSGAGANTAQVVYFAGFHPFGGFLFFLFFIGLLLIAFRPRRGHWGRHGMMGDPGHWGGPARWGGPGYWGSGPTGDPSDPRRSWIADAHRRLHEEEARTTGPTTGGAPTGAATGGPAGTSTQDAGSGGPTTG